MNSYALIIDDNEDIRETLEIALDYIGFKSTMAKNGLEAIQFLKTAETLPKIILLDLRMPEMDGESFRVQQLQDLRLSKIPTVLLSADTHTETIADKMKISMILKKPFSLNDLKAIISSI